MSHDRLALARNRINWLLVRCKIKCEWTLVGQSRIIWFSYATVIRRRVVLWSTLDDFWATVCRTVRPMLSGRCFSVCPVCPVCVPVCLSVTLKYCGQTVGRIKMNLAVQVGLRPGHIVLHGVPAVDPAPPHNGAGAPPQFSAHVYCGQMAGWMTMPLSTEVGLCPGHIVLDGDPYALW